MMFMLHLQHIAVVQERMRPGTEVKSMVEWGFANAHGFANVRLAVQPFPVNATGMRHWKNTCCTCSCSYVVVQHHTCDQQTNKHARILQLPSLTI